jgi:hypothetical protein
MGGRRAERDRPVGRVPHAARADDARDRGGHRGLGSRRRALPARRLRRHRDSRGARLSHSRVFVPGGKCANRSLRRFA